MARRRKERRGRPKLPAADRRDFIVAVKVKRSERAALRRAAKAEGVTVSAWLHRLIRRALGIE